MNLSCVTAQVLRYLLSNLRWWLDEFRCGPQHLRTPHMSTDHGHVCRTLTERARDTVTHPPQV